jgi:DNA-binding MarR family transcriptional regulator
MEFFILALVEKVGLKSLYELRQHAGLEPGGIRSAMKTLEDAKLISRTDPGRRRRRDLALTQDGSAVLERSWPECLRNHADADAVLRAAFVAWLMDSPVTAASYLSHVGQSRRERAQQMQQEADYLKRCETGPLSGYAWMRISHEVHRRSAESAAFLSMGGFIEERFSNNVRNARQSTGASDCHSGHEVVSRPAANTGSP